jgi:hypothetical protein
MFDMHGQGLEDKDGVAVVHTGLRPPLRFGCWFSCCAVTGGASPSGLDPMESSLSSLVGSCLSTDIFSDMVPRDGIAAVDGWR